MKTAVVFSIGCALALLPAGVVPLRADAHAAKGADAAGGKAQPASGHHGPPKYKAGLHVDGKEKEASFDLTSPQQREQLVGHLTRGEVHELKLDQPPNILALRWDVGLWSVVVFIVLYWVLSKFAWPLILDGLQKREGNIQARLDDAEKARAEARKLHEDLTRQLAQAHEQVRGILEEARKDAAHTTEDMIAKARSEIGAERDRLRREVETAKDQAMQELWNQSVQLASILSTKAIRKNLDAAEHQRLFDEAIKELGGATEALFKQQA
jgi:F-type H+-transporting ATPase subunit b